MDFEGHGGFGSMSYGAFPDLHHTIEDIVAEDDGAAVRFTLTGTHEDGFMRIPASGGNVMVPRRPRKPEASNARGDESSESQLPEEP